MNGLVQSPRAAGTTAGRGQPTSDGLSKGLLFAVAANADKLLRIQARTAHQGAIHVGLRHDPGNIVRLDRPPVQDPHLVSKVTCVQVREPGPDGGTDLLGVLWSGHLAGPD